MAFLTQQEPKETKKRRKHQTFTQPQTQTITKAQKQTTKKSKATQMPPKIQPFHNNQEKPQKKQLSLSKQSRQKKQDQN